MNLRRYLQLSVIAWGLAGVSHADAGNLDGPPGEIWIVTSPADCPGAGGALTPYEKEVREQASAALKQLSRTARTIETRRELSDALAGLERRRERGWLLLFFSGHGAIERGVSQLCLADGNGAGKWLDIDQELLRALPKSLSGAVIVLDACSSANVDPHLAAIPTAVISASPYLVEPSALFGSMILSSLSAARDENCNGIFDDEDLFAGMTHRLRARLSTASLEVRPKLRRNAPSPLPIPVPARSSARCTQVATAAAAVASVAGLPEPLVEQRRVQDYLARGSRVLPRLDHDFFVVSGSSAAAVDRVRQLAKTTNLTELQGLTASQAAALAATMTFADIYQLELSPRWLRVWRLRDGLLLSVVRLTEAGDGMPLRTVRSRSELVSPQGLDGPRYAWARRYLREVHEPQGSATPCLESEGQCFVEPVDARPAKE